MTATVSADAELLHNFIELRTLGSFGTQPPLTAEQLLRAEPCPISLATLVKAAVDTQTRSVVMVQLQIVLGSADADAAKALIDDAAEFYEGVRLHCDSAPPPEPAAGPAPEPAKGKAPMDDADIARYGGPRKYINKYDKSFNRWSLLKGERQADGVPLVPPPFACSVVLCVCASDNHNDNVTHTHTHETLTHVNSRHADVDVDASHWLTNDEGSEGDRHLP